MLPRGLAQFDLIGFPSDLRVQINLNHVKIVHQIKLFISLLLLLYCTKVYIIITFFMRVIEEPNYKTKKEISHLFLIK